MGHAQPRHFGDVVDAIDALAGVAGGIVVGVILLILDWWRHGREKRQDRTQSLSEEIATLKTSISEIKTSLGVTVTDVRLLQSAMSEFRTDITAEFGKFSASHSALSARSEDLNRRIGKLEINLERIGQDLQETAQIANEARELGHKHALFGEKA